MSVEIDSVAGNLSGNVAGGNIHLVNIYQAGGGSWNETDYRAALNRYLDWLCAATDRVVLRGIKRGGQQAIDLPLHEVYVALDAEALPEAKEQLKRGLAGQSLPNVEDHMTRTARRITMKTLLAQGRQLVVIGAPGCGKTTVLSHIAWVLAEALRRNQPQLAANRLGFEGELPLPILVPLSLYAEHRRRFAAEPDPTKRQLATFINYYLLERQAGLNLPADFFATLVNQGQHIILLLDGLDEVPNEDERALVSQAVRDLTLGRPHLRFVVTSRTQAYQGKAVLGDNFRRVQVLALEEEQVSHLIRQAYQAIYPQAAEQIERERQSTNLINSVKKLEAERAARLGDAEASRLVTTPLLVRMLLIVHFNLRRLPDQRAELYMEVVDTLLTSDYNPDEAVAQRLAHLGGDWRNRREMLQYLAFHMHSRGQDAGREIGERAMADLLHRYLIKRRRKTESEAERLVEEFISVNRQRGGLLEERDSRYRFGHLSFQEFLTARYLAEVTRQVEAMAQFIEADGRASDSWWREPVLLLLGYLNIDALDTATELTHRLAHLDEAQPLQTAQALAQTELTAVAFLEWAGAETTQAGLAKRLAALLSNPNLTGAAPSLRAAAGRTLAHLGDPRPGVGLRADGLPDIAWCQVPAGPFVMGSDPQKDPQADDNETPQHEVDLPAYQISRYPVTNAQYHGFVAEGGYKDERYWPEAKAAGYWQDGGFQGRWDDKPREAAADFGLPFNLANHPVVGISWYEAVAFGRWLTERLRAEGEMGADQVIRLPTEAEWEKAARGTEARLYPWGNEPDPERANYSDTGLGTTSAVGCFPTGASPFEVLDCAGNVWEWVQSEYRAYPYRADDGRENLDSTDGRVLRGGAFDDQDDFVRASVRYHFVPNGRDDYVGVGLVRAPIGSES
jgi:formylglycine-generating enzyme required for sulfatase activity/energy-coupling factor transporter ATP-binding protein EcfA2